MTTESKPAADPEPSGPSDALKELARSHGIQLEFTDTSGATVAATEASLLAVLKALGVPLSEPGDAERALVDRQLQVWNRLVEPVAIAWDGGETTVDLRLPASLATARVECRLVDPDRPDAEPRSWTVEAGSLPLQGSADLGGRRFVARKLAIPAGLPTGYHRLEVSARGAGADAPVAAEALVISAPTRAYQPPDDGGRRLWGMFCPLHALHGARSWGAGDHSDLESLIDWTAEQGGNLVATLPMLATAFDGPAPHISPYSPTSRLFWNEFYLDLEKIPDLDRSPEARAILGSAETKAEVDALRSMDLVHYGRQMRLKRSVLEALAGSYFAQHPDGTDGYRTFLADNPDVESYAFFQAAGERHGRDWRSWPESLNGPDRLRQVDPKAYRYHLYAQWRTDQQLGHLAKKAADKGMTWYLDFPVGVDFNSFDVWRESRAFAVGASVGCPPDLVFTKGQNWGFPPLHPDRLRESGYRYLIASFRNHLRHANALRIDHVMGLHRLFWIPDGADARHGAYVQTSAEEIYAILSVESHRRDAWLVGEDLGTVPPEVESALCRHAVSGMYVIQYELKTEPDRPLRTVPELTVASVNTHDMPPFAAFWTSSDLLDRKEMGLLDDATMATEQQTRDDQKSAVVGYLRSEGFLDRSAPADDAAKVLDATWGWLAASASKVVLLNVEDLWLETEPQNTPNTSVERPNWQRKLRQPFEQFSADPGNREALKKVARLRARPPAAPPAAPDAKVEDASA